MNALSPELCRAPVSKAIGNLNPRELGSQTLWAKPDEGRANRLLSASGTKRGIGEGECDVTPELEITSVGSRQRHGQAVSENSLRKRRLEAGG